MTLSRKYPAGIQRAIEAELARGAKAPPPPAPPIEAAASILRFMVGLIIGLSGALK